MTIVYLAVGILLTHDFYKPNCGKGFNTLTSITLMITLLGSLSFLFLFPIIEWPRPVGSYCVGTKRILLTDRNRVERFDQNQSHRKIPIQIWYPAEIDAAAKDGDQYFIEPFNQSKIWANGAGLTFAPFILSHLGVIETNHRTNAKISGIKDNYPVLIFSHGYLQSDNFNQYLLENLASCGFIVLSISHEYETPYSFYPGNKIIVYDRRNSVSQKLDDEYCSARIGSIVKQLNETNIPESKIKCLERLNMAMPGWLESNLTWMEDIIFCLDNLGMINEGMMERKINTSKIGVVGYSFGGGASGLAAMKDRRIKACINIDGFQTIAHDTPTLLCPTLFVYSEEHKSATSYFAKLTEQLVYEINMENTKHSNFSDISLHNEYVGKLFGFLGNADVRKSLRILIINIILFLEESLDEKVIYKDNIINETIYKIIQ